jgi:hypothetical protein
VPKTSVEAVQEEGRWSGGVNSRIKLVAAWWWRRIGMFLQRVQERQNGRDEL